MKRKIKPTLNDEGVRLIQQKVEWEGDFLYVMENWDFHEEIKDKKFRSLRKALVKAASELKDYCRIEEELAEPEEEEFDPGQGIDDASDYESCIKCGDALDKDGTCHTCTDEEPRIMR